MTDIAATVEAREAAGLAAALARVREWSAADRAAYAPARAAIRAAAEAAGLAAAGESAARAALGEAPEGDGADVDEYVAPDARAAAARLAEAAWRSGDVAHYSLAVPQVPGHAYLVRVGGRDLARVVAAWRGRARRAARAPLPASAVAPAGPFARALAPYLALAAEARRLAAGLGDAGRAARLWALVGAVGGRAGRGRGRRRDPERDWRESREREGRDGRDRAGALGRLAGGPLVPAGGRSGRRVALYVTSDAEAARLRLASVPGGEVRAHDPEFPGDARLRRATLYVGGRPAADVYNLLEYEAVMVDAAGAPSPWATAYLRLVDAWVASLVLESPAAAVREALADVAAAVAAAAGFEPAGYAGAWEDETAALKRAAAEAGAVEYAYRAGAKKPAR